MTLGTKPSPEQILQARAENPKIRERDFSSKLGISEAEFVAAHCAHIDSAAMSARRIDIDIKALLDRAPGFGEVMTLTRNESAVHEKIGTFEKTYYSQHASMALGPIDLRIFPKHWVYGFAVNKQDGELTRHSLQFFDAAGEAVHKIHLRSASNVEVYKKFVEEFLSEDQGPSIEVSPYFDNPKTQLENVDVTSFRDRWAALTDVHQFVGLLKDFSINRHQAVRLAGNEFAWRVDPSSVEAMMRHAVDQKLSIMCFVGSRGCIQIHTGPIYEIKLMGPWINVLDPTFHLHLRGDHIKDAWVVRKPTKNGHVTSIEAYDSTGELIIQFFGERHEGQIELQDWRMIVENLPRLPLSDAA
ncbi:hemin-degrading factor [Falsochrobactrum ovis]|uniref:Putative hemin transport protein n=1 Tax=Falsochrobactrum ovis TaxID=1293442 RepID=A0A364JRR4_9HYPH|nr:ChuX/HutX family heme-like substrate-binding protein [Falsochrobactrum ovis]RAK24684.1 putative hemin transport protein [Falsochrobactrum ovis]